MPARLLSFAGEVHMSIGEGTSAAEAVERASATREPLEAFEEAKALLKSAEFFYEPGSSRRR